MAAFAGACVLAVMLVVLFNSSTAERVSLNATILHRANATLGTSALVRAAAGQVSIFDELVDDGVASNESLEAAEVELTTVNESLVHLVQEADEQTAILASKLVDIVEQRPIDMQAMEVAFSHLREDLLDEVHAAELAIESNEDAAERMSILLRLAVLLIIPVSVILLYRRRAVSQVRQAKAEMDVAFEAERTIVRAKNEFVAGLSHEMRTPLTAIFGFSELLLETVDDDSVREMVAEIHRQSSELGRMVDDFIAMSRIDSGTIVFGSEPVRVETVARSLTSRFAQLGAAIEVVGSSALVLADADKVDQILTNLIVNAVQYGGQRVRVEIFEEDDSVLCEVVDDGNGIPDDVESRLFKRFVNEGPEVLTNGSHGLGTWVAATFAERMGGSITYTRRDHETVFCLRLPVAMDCEEERTNVSSEGLVST